ncbi:MAG: hypothetical protein HS103_08525 [Anaerolineales bacterium]|nr:hypothetical protein [Anaerolineales bacterium]
MTRFRFLLLMLLCACLLSGGKPSRAQEGTRAIVYWDIGLRLAIPASWKAPIFTAGEMVITPSGSFDPAAVDRVISLRIVDPVRDLRLAKDTSLEMIAASVSIAPDSGVIGSERGVSYVAGLRAGYINVDDPKNGLMGQSTAFRIPDGRVVVMIAVAADAQWAEFALVYDAIRTSAALVLPTVYSLPDLRQTPITFPAGGVGLELPLGWKEIPLAPNAALYRDASLSDYRDDTGFVNGVQLVIIAEELDTTLTAAEAVGRVIQARKTDVLTPLTIGGREGAVYTEIDRASGQIISFIGVKSDVALIVFRWTTPGHLAEVTQPLLDSILASVTFTPLTR